jgi:uncharacterized protein (TIGR02996 family)
MEAVTTRWPMAESTRHDPRVIAALALARAAASRYDLAGVRDALIDAWRAGRSPAVARLVELVATKAPDALTAKLAALVKHGAVSSHANLRALLEIDDPRLSGRAIEALVALPFATSAAAPAFLSELIDTVGRLGDARITECADAIRGAITTRIEPRAVRRTLIERLEEVIAGLPPVAATPEEISLERELAMQLEPLRADSRAIETLIAEIYANPADDAQRLVLADLLLQRGDPRGELIALQFGRGDGEPTKRELRLLQKHGRSWLGRLAPVLSWGRHYSRTAFRRGFLAVADIMLSVDKKLEPLAGAPEWATVEKLTGRWNTDLLLTAPLRGLRSIDDRLDAATIEALSQRREPLANVIEVRLMDPKIDGATLRRAFPALTTVKLSRNINSWPELLAVRHLAVDHVAITDFWVPSPERVAIARQELDAFVRSLVGQPTELARLSIDGPYYNPPVPAPVELRRGADGKFERVE